MASSRSGSDDFVFPANKRLFLPESLRGELRELLEPLTPVEKLTESLSGMRKIVSVGDLCSLTLIEAGIHPDVCIVDFKTKRSPLEERQKANVCAIGKNCVKVANPAATITGELWKAVAGALESGEKTRIEVNGEEDLASLAAISMAPAGTAVIYGIPNMGIAVVHIDRKAKAWADGILRRMEVV
jgi:hypothetical protein